ncbi:hypothetical protein [Fervidicoccus fontis]|uniref:hypothetical protein n=1 Tax=Fervidicoccus fontis TaxID=683846 RepID=UPI002AD43601|nr:hypothetical protein [Fervidicoccus fontis]
MKHLDLIIPYSPSNQVLIGTLGYELLASDNIERVIVLSENDAGSQAEALRSIGKKLGISVEIKNLGTELHSWSSFSMPPDSVLDITPGRKIYASLLLQSCMKREGCRARYLYLEDEKKYGYNYFGYMPMWAFKFIEFHPELHQADLSVRRLEKVLHAEGIEEKEASVIPETFQSIINLHSYSGDEEFSIEACGGRAEFRFGDKGLFLKDFSFLGKGDEEAFDEALKSFLEIENRDEAAEKAKKCIDEGGVIALDTNVLIQGRMFNFLRSHSKNVEILKPVWSEIIPYALEEKISSVGRRRLAALSRAAALNNSVPAMRDYRRGDQEIINSLKNMKNEKMKVCFMSSDRRLSAIVSTVLGDDTIFLESPELREESRTCAEEVAGFMMNLAFYCNEGKLRIGREEYMFKLGKISNKTLQMPELRVSSESMSVLKAIDLLVRATV